MDPVVEDAEIRLGRASARSEQEGGLGELLGGAAGFALGGKGVAHDEVIASLSIFAHDAAEIGGLDLFRPFVFDAEFLLRLLQRHMDLVIPRLLDRRGEDGGDFHLLVLREGKARQHDRRQAGCAEPENLAARKWPARTGNPVFIAHGLTPLLAPVATGDHSLERQTMKRRPMFVHTVKFCASGCPPMKSKHLPHRPRTAGNDRHSILHLN